MKKENENLLELIQRRAVAIYSIEGLKEKLESGKKLTIKFGADPSRPDLHLGHTVPLRILKAFQDAGHEVVFLIGDYTAMIGDPSGKSKTRPSLTREETAENGRTYMEQVGKVLDLSKNVRVEYNSKWFEKMSFEEVLKLSSKYTVARLLERDDFANRYNANKPIGVHEFMYPLMQGYDSVMLNSDIEIGGTDQTFNVLVGRELQRDYNQTPQEVITFPLLLGLDGVEKMSKSLGNYIGISDPADLMFEKCMRVPDNMLKDYFALTTDYDIALAEKLMKEDIMQAHIVYATEIVTMYHSKEDAEKALARYKEVAKGGIPENILEVNVEKENPTLIDCLMASKLCNSTSEARRLIQQNGVKVNGEIINEFNKIVEKGSVIQKGKNKFVKIV